MVNPKKEKPNIRATGVSKISAAKIKPIPETPEPLLKTPKKRKYFGKKTVILVAVFIVLLGVGFAYRLYSSTVDNIVIKEDSGGFLTQVKNIAQKDEKMLKGQEEDRINILLLGIGGKNHPGGTLTDTNLIVSIKPSTGEAAMISLPRDLVVKIYDDDNPKYWEGRKINYLYELGGPELASEKLGEVTGLDVHYFVILDFDGFRKIIDDMGGLDIDVENGFTDREYPDYNYGYQTISFKKGDQLMDGETALQYARSRHGNNGEGSDFARAKRQQKIIETSKEKFLTPEVIANPSTALKILEDIGDHLDTNIEVWEMVKFAEIAKEIEQDKIINKVVDNSPGGLVYSKIYPQTGAYVLIPNAGEYNFSEIHYLTKNIFDFAELHNETAKIEIQNGTLKNGLAAQTADQLKTLDLDVIRTGNAKDQNNEITTIYDFSDGSKSLTLDFIKEELGAKAVLSMSYDEFLLNVSSVKIPEDGEDESSSAETQSEE